MGNKCCSGDHKKGIIDTSNPPLQIIKEAQRKYFNSHIENDLDSSCDEDDKEDSLDGLYGSQASLVNGDDDAFENTTLSSSILIDTANILLSTMNTSADDDSSSVMGSSNVKNNTSKQDQSSATNTLTRKECSKTNVKTEPVVKRRDKTKYIRLSKRGNFFSIFNSEDRKARSVDPKMYMYPFENLVFEGGGNKGLAYCGAVRLLEELNIWPQIKRLAGTSAGAMTATLLAIGYDSHDLEQFFSLNLNKIFLDHKLGYLSLLPNLLRSYGWNPGQRIYKWFGQRIYDKTGDMDTTFKQVYEKYNRELCIVVTNLNQMTSLYCHPKTTPDMPVRLAVRMSMCIPGLFKAVKHTLHGQTDVFVDGGVLCNYPIHCFDGWWLSMEPEDSFLQKLQPLEDIPRLLERSERFGKYNEKTLGMQLYSDNEQDLLKYQLENLRHGVELQQLPNTKLAREKIKKKKLQLKTDREHRRLVKAMNGFLRALNQHNIDKNDTIDRHELEEALNDQELFPQKKRLILFGDVDSSVILDYLDKDHNGQISYNELLSFMEETGISMQNRFLGYQRRNIKNFSSFLDTLQATLLTNVKRVYVEERDLKRTVGINTGHVGTSDFVLEPADIEFVIERGRRSLEAFLKYYVATNHLKKRPEYKRLHDDNLGECQASSHPSSLDQSCENGSNAIHQTVQGVANGLLPLASDLRSDDAKGHTTMKDLPVSASPAHSDTNRNKSGSSTKSVSISERVEIMRDFERDENENLNSDHEESENVFLLGDHPEHKDKTRHGNQTGILTAKTHRMQPTERLAYHEISGQNSSCLKQMNTPSNSSTSEYSKLKPLKVNVQIHKTPETS